MTLIKLDGTEVRLAPGTNFNVGEAFGQMLVDLVKAMRTEKAFATLRLGIGCGVVDPRRRVSVRLSLSLRRPRMRRSAATFPLSGLIPCCCFSSFRPAVTVATRIELCVSASSVANHRTHSSPPAPRSGPPPYLASAAPDHSERPPRSAKSVPHVLRASPNFHGLCPNLYRLRPIH